MRRHLSACLAALALLAAAPLPGVGPADGRHAVDPAAAPWSALARLQVPGTTRCTAVLLAPRLALTAAHCLWSARLRRFVPPDMVHVLRRYERGDYAGHSIAASWRIAPGQDVAAVTLAEPLRGPTLRLAPLPVPGTPAMLGGYNQGRNEVIEADTACHILAEGGALLRHDCEGTHGTSGAPLLVRGADGQWQVAGIETRAVVAGRGGIAVAAAGLQPWLAEQGDAK